MTDDAAGATDTDTELVKHTVQDDNRWLLTRDLVSFQVKLALDGLRDLILSPIALVATLIGFVFGGDQPGKYFYALLNWGHETDQWIGLFRARHQHRVAAHKDESERTVDQMLDHVEKVVSGELQHSAPAHRFRDLFERTLDRIKLR